MDNGDIEDRITGLRLGAAVVLRALIAHHPKRDFLLSYLRDTRAATVGTTDATKSEMDALLRIVCDPNPARELPAGQ